MTDFSRATVSYSIGYNWPPGYSSFHGLGAESKHNHDLGIRYRVYAKKEGAGEKYFTFEEAMQPLTSNELSKIFQEKSSKGIYLIGDLFLVEVCDPEGNVLFGVKTNAKEKWPPDAHGATSTIASYYTQTQQVDGV